MHDTTATQTAPRPNQSLCRQNANPRYAALYRRYPTIEYLRRGARAAAAALCLRILRRRFGQGRPGIRRNWAGLDAVEMVPRYGVMPALPPCEVELFGRRYSAPIGVSPMGGPAIVWPGADENLARAAQKRAHP